MSGKPVNDTWQKQNNTLVRAVFKKGFINAINNASRTVDVYYAENPNTIIRSIPLADTINITTLKVGKRCRIDVFDETNPADSVVAFTY